MPWVCEICGELNSDDRETCEHCGSHKWAPEWDSEDDLEEEEEDDS